MCDTMCATMCLSISSFQLIVFMFPRGPNLVEATEAVRAAEREMQNARKRAEQAEADANGEPRLIVSNPASLSHFESACFRAGQ